MFFIKVVLNNKLLISIELILTRLSRQKQFTSSIYNKNYIVIKILKIIKKINIINIIMKIKIIIIIKIINIIMITMIIMIINIIMILLLSHDQRYFHRNEMELQIYTGKLQYSGR